MRGAFTVGVGLAVALLARSGAPPPNVANHAHKITIRDLSFGPPPPGIRVGDTIEWANEDILLHSVTAVDKSFDVDIAPGKTAQIVMRKPGVIAYFCKYHPGMKGTLTVAKN